MTAPRLSEIPRSPLDRARGLRDLVRQRAARNETNRTLDAETVDALWQSGLMRVMNPPEAGGQPADLRQWIEMWEELAWQDGSVGWIGIANFPATAFAAAYLPDAGFQEVFGEPDRRVTMGGQLAPNGQGQVIPGGYRLTGSWSFGSGTGHSAYVMGGFMPFRDGSPVMAASGLPDMQVAVMPRDEIEFLDGWHVTGLKATGSFDYRVEDVFVPRQRVFPLLGREVLRGGPIFGLGALPITAAGHASWALGVSRSALDDLRDLAASKQRMGDPTTLIEKPTFQRGFAHHESMWRAARGNVLATFGGVGDAMLRGGELTPLMRADMRLAATYATEAAREIVEFAHLQSGTAAIREGTRLERAFRDLYTGSQHAFISERTYLDAARILLGLDLDNPGL